MFNLIMDAQEVDVFLLPCESENGCPFNNDDIELCEVYCGGKTNE